MVTHGHEQRQLVTVRAICERTSLSERYVRRLVADGVLESVRISDRAVRVYADSFDRWLAGRGRP